MLCRNALLWTHYTRARDRGRHARQNRRNTAFRRAPVLRIGLFLMNGFQPMSLAPLSVFEAANGHLKARPYEAVVVSADGARLQSPLGVRIETVALGSLAFDTLLVGATGNIDVGATESAAWRAFREQATLARRTGSIGNGTQVLAAAGLLDGRRAAVHWSRAAAFQARFPAVGIAPEQVFVADGPIWTSADMAGAMDMTLAMVEKDFGYEIARSTAHSLALTPRGEHCSIEPALAPACPPRPDRVQSALTHAALHLRENLTVETLAEVAHLSPRHFTRLFRSQTGQSPAKAVEGLRLEVAKFRVAYGHRSIEEIAVETGFRDRERMRRAFMRAYGQTPAQLRVATRSAATLQAV